MKRQRRHGTRIRESYGEAIKQRVAFDQDIHHIDHAHTNNDFKNLVAIPKELHRKYHSVFDLCRNKGFSIGYILRELKAGNCKFIDLQLLYNEIMSIKNNQNIALLYSEAFQWSPNGKCPFLMPKGEITVSNEIKDSCMGIIHILIAESL